jgi:hypothetical protein
MAFLLCFFPAARRHVSAQAAMVLAAAGAPAFGAVPAATIAPEEERFLEEVQRASFRFFEEQTHPRTGLVSDRAAAGGGAHPDGVRAGYGLHFRVDVFPTEGAGCVRPDGGFRG